MIQKTLLLLTALTTDVTNTLASGFIYRRPASWGRRKRKTNRKTSTKTSSPCDSPKQYHICLDMGGPAAIDWNEMYGKHSTCRKPLELMQLCRNKCKYRYYCKREIKSKVLLQNYRNCSYLMKQITTSFPTQLHNEKLTTPPHCCKQHLLALPEKKVRQESRFLICSPSYAYR